MTQSKFPVNGKPKPEALNLVERAMLHRTRIWAILAQDDAQSERSIEYHFSVEDSLEIFKAVDKALKK